MNIFFLGALFLFPLQSKNLKIILLVLRVATLKRAEIRLLFFYAM